MGTWGPGMFENDSATDLQGGGDDNRGVQMLEEALDRVLSAGDSYLEAPEAEEALAAAEIVARLKGAPEDGIDESESLKAWIGNMRGTIPKNLVQKARESTKRIIREPSELLELWSSSAEYKIWRANVERILDRL